MIAGKRERWLRRLPVARGPDLVSSQVTEARRYYLNLKPGVSGDFVVVFGGVERCRPDYLVQRDNFPYQGIEFVEEGSGTLTLAGRDYVLRPGLAFAYGPGVPHVIRNNAKTPLLKHYVDFMGRRAERELAASVLGQWRPVQVADMAEPLEILEALHRNAAAQSPVSARVCALLVSILMLKIQEKAVAPGGVHRRAYPTYERVRRYLEQNCPRLRTVEEAARVCAVNPSYLCRLFQRYHHGSPYQYLRRLKMGKAAELLLHGDLPLKQVAEAVGFPDPYSLSHAFKAVYGLSPMHFVEHARRHGLR